MAPEENKHSRLQRISSILNYIGATLIFIGICYWLSFNWELLTAVIRIVLSLGTACWILLVAVSLTKQGQHATSSGALFMLGGLLLPLGISITFNAFGMDSNLDIMKVIVPAICFAVFLVLELRYSRDILLLFCVVFGTLFYLAGFNFLNDNGIWFPGDSLISYEALVLGVCYVLLAYGLTFTKSGLTGCLCIVGESLILLSSFYLAGLFFEPSANYIWEILAPIILLGSFLLYIPFNKKVLLSLSTLFLIIYITRLTYRFSYIFSSIGWPMLLIIVGVVLMMTAFILISVQKHLLSKQTKLYVTENVKDGQ